MKPTVRIVTLVTCVLCLCGASTTSAQNAVGEVSFTGGASTDRVLAGATQGRVFGDTPWFTFFTEGTWTTHTAGHGVESEAFGTAYPYEGPPRVMDAYAEKIFSGTRFLGSVRAGRFRTPVGISGVGDHAYSGFTRAPLIRYEGYWALSNMFFEHGVNAMVGTSSVQLEVTAARPADAGEALVRRPGTDTIVRLQTYHGPLLVGVSHIRSETYGPASVAHGPMVFTGVDFRWMVAGVQFRGEWLTGRPWDGTSLNGGYLDALIHRPFMGPVTLVTRIETLDYKDLVPTLSSRPSGGAVGARVKLVPGLYGQVNVTHRPGEPYGRAVTATDVALTYTVRYRK